MNDLNPDRGAIAWMARNSVAANLLMLLLIVGGILIGVNIQQEVFPEFDLDFVQVLVPYPGASPAEVEQGILLSIEDGVRGLDGVKRVTSNAFEGNGRRHDRAVDRDEREQGPAGHPECRGSDHFLSAGGGAPDRQPHDPAQGSDLSHGLRRSRPARLAPCGGTGSG